MKSQLEKKNINVITHEESYTSKCDSLSLESLNKKKYEKNRISRGLFRSKIGKFINADLNGAINIMRKVIDLKKIRGANLFGPKLLIL